MDDDQQFCLRWNNHQSTLISVFDTLLENETLVDCTLAAEGKFLKAHKVVLSACSPYFATLLQEQYDKHPIFILKDVKYQELRAMMDYMYRGEVNISQDQLAALLKAAESLQIKGLSDNRSSSGGGPKHDPPQQQQQQQLQHRGLGLPGIGGGLGLGGISGKHGAGSGYTLEQTKRARLGPASIDSQDHSGSREGSSSPTSRRRRKLRRRSIDNTMSDVHHENSNSSQIQSIATTSSLLQQQPNSGLGNVGAIAAAASALASHVPPSVAAVLPTTAVAAASNMAGISTAVQSAAAQQQMTVGVPAGPTTSATKKTENVKGSSGVGGSSTDVMHSELLASIEEQQQEQQQQSAGLVELKTEKQNHKQQKSVLGKDVSATTGSSVTSTELVIEPKSEYDEEGNEENVEDLTLDDEDMGMEDLDHNAGTSHGNEGSSQGYAQWQHDRSQDEVFMATQEAQQRDPQDLSITRIAGLTWNEWNARLAMPLVTQLREGVHPLVFPTDLSVDKHNNHSSTSSAAVAIACGGGSSGVGSTGLLLSTASDRKSPCFSAASLSVTVSNVLGPTAATVATTMPSSPSSPPPETTTTSPLPPNNLLCETGGNATAAGPSGSCITSTIDTTPHNCSSNLSTDKLASKLKQISEDESAVLMLKATSNEKATNNSGNMSDNSFGGGDDGVSGAGNASGDYHSALSGAGAFGDGVGNASGLCNINILSSISAMNSLIGGGNGGIGIGIGSGSGHPCPECGRVYKLKSSLRNHQKWECGKEPQFQCPFCVYRAKQKMHIGRHMERMHKEKFLKLDDIKSYTGGGGSGSGGGANVGVGNAGGGAEESGNTTTSTTTATAAAAAVAAAAVAAAELRQHFSS